MAAPKNPLGAKSDKIWRDAVMRAVKRRQEGAKTPHLDRLADKLVARGLEGEVSALKEIGDRLDGKPTTSIDVADDVKEAFKGFRLVFGA
jgi:hypothetical protein